MAGARRGHIPGNETFGIAAAVVRGTPGIPRSPFPVPAFFKSLAP